MALTYTMWCTPARAAASTDVLRAAPDHRVEGLLALLANDRGEVDNGVTADERLGEPLCQRPRRRRFDGQSLTGRHPAAATRHEHDLVARGEQRARGVAPTKPVPPVMATRTCLVLLF